MAMIGYGHVKQISYLYHPGNTCRHLLGVTLVVDFFNCEARTVQKIGPKFDNQSRHQLDELLFFEEIDQT